MASIKLGETKDGRRFFQISVSRGYGKSQYKTRWYWPDGWSKRTAERRLQSKLPLSSWPAKTGRCLIVPRNVKKPLRRPQRRKG